LLAGTLESRFNAPTAGIIRKIVDQLLETEDKNLPHVFRSLERAHSRLHNMIDLVLKGNPVPFSRSDAAVAELELIGLLKNQQGRCAIRNRIYQEAILRRRDVTASPVVPREHSNSQPDLDSCVASATARTRTQGFKQWTGASRTTLAIVFTDIVGSTSLGSEVGDERMYEIRQAHHRQARQLIHKFGGCEIDTAGDAFVVAFHTALEALNFALELSGSTGHERIKIRAGIHVGPIRIEGKDAFGLMMNCTARVESFAKGAEIWAE
jgi:class 3 adenylate cyclase